ncbi:hypothetical protein [Pigmentiphaga litoralis]
MPSALLATRLAAMALLAACLTACGGDDASSGNDSTPSQPQAVMRCAP